MHERKVRSFFMHVNKVFRDLNTVAEDGDPPMGGRLSPAAAVGASREGGASRAAARARGGPNDNGGERRQV